MDILFGKIQKRKGINIILCLKDKEKYVLIEDGVILESKFGNPPKKEYDIIINGPYLSRGLVNGHIHISMYKYAGLKKEEQDLIEFFKSVLWPLEKKLSSKEIYESAYEGCLKLIEKGTTFFYNMNPWWKEPMKAVLKTKIRSILSIAIKTEKDLNENLKLFKEKSPLIIPYLGIANEIETPKEIIELIKKENKPIKAHCAEHPSYRKIINEEYGYNSSVEYFNSLGLLNETTILAHCIHVNTKDINIIKEKGSNVVFNPISNKRLRDGLPNIPFFLEKKINCYFGTDEPIVEPDIDVRKVGEFVHKYYNISKKKIIEILTNYSKFPFFADFVIWSQKDILKAEPLYVIVNGKIIGGKEF